MPKCKVTTSDGQHLDVEADGYELLRESGFVILKKKLPDGQTDQTVGVFLKPVAVLLNVPDTDSVSGS